MFSAPRYYLCVAGIRQNLRREDWSERACARLRELDPFCRTDDYDYRCGLIKTPGQARRCVDVRQKLNGYADHRRVPIGHSNGCDIICRVLRETPGLRVESIHLFAAATSADYRKNGLNLIVARGQVREIYLYCSENDRALWAGGMTEDLFGWMGLGYGSLGRRGPRHQTDAARAATHVIWRDEFDHSDWFRGEHFDHSMRWCLR